MTVDRHVWLAIIGDEIIAACEQEADAARHVEVVRQYRKQQGEDVPVGRVERCPLEAKP